MPTQTRFRRRRSVWALSPRDHSSKAPKRVHSLPRGGRGDRRRHQPRIPGSAASRDFMHTHKWKRGATETEATAKEIRRKASRIAPAYNKGALQYLPDD